MTKRSTWAKGTITVAVAAAALSAGLATPQWAKAQPYQDQQQGTYYDPCRRDQSDRAVTGGVLGAVAGAVIGNSVARGGGRTGGTIIGGLAGAAVGAKVGQSTAACTSAPPAPAAYSDYPPPPPPPPAYVEAPPPPPACGRAQERISYPDGSVETYPVRACQDNYGRWSVVQ